MKHSTTVQVLVKKHASYNFVLGLANPCLFLLVCKFLPHGILRKKLQYVTASSLLRGLYSCFTKKDIEVQRGSITF